MNIVIKKPVISEKSYNLGALNKYMFEVSMDTNKQEIKKAIKELYKVDAISVNITHRKPKTSRVGRQTRTKPEKKIAIVTLKKDQKIELFEEHK
ncbi:50S ribosomal protein L23 [bacterium]|nr:50S ribosomal protein L23 [bacterium]